MARLTLTLDIKERGIDWVLLRTGLRSVQIEKSGHLVCRIDDDDMAGAVAPLRELRDAITAPGLTCLTAIEGHGLFARSVNVPFQDRRKVRQILPLELEATLPVPIDELVMDFLITGNGDGHTALSAAMSRDRINFFLERLHEAGLDPVLMTFSGLPAAMLLAAGPDGAKSCLLIDGDDDHATLFLIGGHQLLYLRSWIPPRTPEDPAQRLKLAVDQTLISAPHVLPDTTDIGSVYLTSRGARHYPPDKLNAALGVTAKVFDPSRATRPNLSGELAGGYGQGALALGLYEPMAEKGLNLFRATFPLRRFLQQHRQPLIRSGVLAAALILLFLAGVFMDIRRNEARVEALAAETEAILKQTFPETRNTANPLPQMIVKLRAAREDDLAAHRGVQVRQIDILQAISQSLPPKLDIHVSQLVAGTERVQISGTTGTFEAVNEARGHLEQTGIFDNITIISANMDQRVGRVRFRISADLPSRS